MERTVFSKEGNLPRKREKFEVNSTLLFLIHKYALLGKTQKEIAPLIGMNIGTFRNYMENYPEMEEAYLSGGDDADGTTVGNLYMLANGYTKEVEIVHSFNGKAIITKYNKWFEPSVVAQKFILSNRQKVTWSESKTTEGFNNTQININNNYLQSLSMEELQASAFKGLKKQNKDNAEEAEVVDE